MPTKTLYADGNSGIMLISTYGTTLTGDNGAIINPGNNLSNLYFHSALNYIQIKGSVVPATTVTFPLLARTLITWTDPASKSGC